MFLKTFMKTVILFELITILGAACWGGISLATIPLGEMGFTSSNLVFLRMSFSLVFSALLLLITPKKFKIKLKHLPIFIGMGAGGYMLTSLLNIYSIALCGSGVAAMLMNTSPIWLTILATIFFKEKLSVLKVLSLIGVVGGCVCLCFGDSANFSLVGVLAGLGAGVTFALYCFLGKMASLRGYSANTTNFYIFLFASISAIPFTNFYQIGNLINNDVGNSMLYLILLALFFTVLPSVLYNFGIKKISASTAGIIGIAEPLTASVIGFAVFNEKVTVLGIVGIVAIVASLIVLQISYKEKPDNFEWNQKSPDQETTEQPNSIQSSHSSE